MRKWKFSKIWFPAFLLALVISGCGDPDKNVTASNPGGQFTPPTVLTVTPPDGNVDVCPNANPVIITAIFSKAMNPATINTTTFTLTGPGGTSVAGAVTYVVSTNTATFTPSTPPLSASTVFTATITTGATDMFGNSLAANFVWTFTTSAVCAPPPPGIGSACGFGILGATPVVSSTGNTIVTGGNVGIWPAKSITGFPPAIINGGTIDLGTAISQQAQSDLTVAYNNAAGAAGGAALTADIGGQTLPAGVYKATTTLGITGDLTLTGTANAVWIFQVGTALTTAAGTTGGVPNSRVILIGGAQAKNVTWQIGSSATLGTFSVFVGNLMAQDSITMGTSATLNGRALARTGAVTMDTNAVTVPSCP
ncbi:MAG: ice-binding family protein [Candidatus Acidiferrum sp.]